MYCRSPARMTDPEALWLPRAKAPSPLCSAGAVHKRRQSSLKNVLSSQRMFGSGYRYARQYRSSVQPNFFRQAARLKWGSEKEGTTSTALARLRMAPSLSPLASCTSARSYQSKSNAGSWRRLPRGGSFWEDHANIHNPIKAILKHEIFVASEAPPLQQ